MGGDGRRQKLGKTRDVREDAPFAPWGISGAALDAWVDACRKNRDPRTVHLEALGAMTELEWEAKKRREKRERHRQRTGLRLVRDGERAGEGNSRECEASDGAESDGELGEELEDELDEEDDHWDGTWERVGMVWVACSHPRWCGRHGPGRTSGSEPPQEVEAAPSWLEDVRWRG